MMEQEPRVASGHCKFLGVKKEEGRNVCPLLKQEINLWFFHVLPGSDITLPTLTWGAHNNGRTGSSLLWSCPLLQHWPQPGWGSVGQGRVGHTHEKYVWASKAKGKSLHTAEERSTSWGFAFADIPSQNQTVWRFNEWVFHWQCFSVQEHDPDPLLWNDFHQHIQGNLQTLDQCVWTQIVYKTQPNPSKTCLGIDPNSDMALFTR